MNHKKIFLLAVAIGLVFLACSCPLASAWRLILDEDRAFAVTTFNLLLDFVVGVFTVWGLFWAATEFSAFAVRPEVRLLAGTETPEEGARGPCFEVPGNWHESGPASNPGVDAHINPPLYLINTTSRAARHVFVVLKCRAPLKPDRFEFTYSTAQPEESKGPLRKERETRHGQEGIWLPFLDDLVVYEDAVKIGILFLFWSAEIDAEALPRRVVIEYDIYSLDGASHSEVELRIKWN